MDCRDNDQQGSEGDIVMGSIFSSPPKPKLPPPGPSPEEVAAQEAAEAEAAETAQREKDAKKSRRGRAALIATSRLGLLGEEGGAPQNTKLGG